jgi:cobalt-zinc-cadmium efflux system outer membrane protein
MNMHNEQPRVGRLTRKPRASKKVAVVILFLTFLTVGFVSEPRGSAETLSQNPVQGKANPHPAGQETTKSAAQQSQQQPGAHQHQTGQPQQRAADPVKSPQTQSTTADPHAGHQVTTSQQQAQPVGPVITLAELERMAAQNNPTLAQAEAAISAAQGRRRQAGLWPNPIVGYMGEEISFRAPKRTSEHMFFVEQTIPLGGKLRKSQRIAEQEIAEAEAEAFAQKQRVINTVRILYFEALGAQRLVDLRAELVRIARDAVKTTSELYNVGQADRPDFFEAEIEAQQIVLDFEEAQNALQQSWQLLAAVAGNPTMQQARLAGNLEEGLPVLDQEALLATLLRDSPEIRRARAEVERARAVVSRAKAERIPNLFLRGGVGYNNELLDVDDRPVGKEAFIEAGINLPIFNRNQGAIAAAEAELTLAEREAQRIDLVLRTRLTQAFTEYRNSLRKVQRYQETVLPRAERAYNLYLASFRQMSASYPQVLIAQRTMFQVREDYLRALIDVRANAIQIEGFLLTGGLNAPRLQPFEGDEGGENQAPAFMHGRRNVGAGQERER